MSVMICGTFVLINFIVSDFGFEKFGNKKFKYFDKYFDFIFLEN